MDEQQAVTPVRTRRRPSRAGRGHRAALEGLTLALVFSLGLLAGDSSSHPASYGAVYPAYDGSH